jgi:hypothetical protein
MSEPLIFEDKDAFLEALRELKAKGYGRDDMRIYLPWHLPEVEEILEITPGPMRHFAVFGGITGFVGGLALTIYTALSWPLIVGGKPVVSIPPFLLVAYILTILFGGLMTFAGFLLLAQLPRASTMMDPEDYGNCFAIVLRQQGDSSWRR